MTAIDLDELLLKLKWSEEGAQIPDHVRAQLVQLREEQERLARAGMGPAGTGPGAALYRPNAFQAGWASQSQILQTMQRDASRATTAVTQLSAASIGLQRVGTVAIGAGRGLQTMRGAATMLAVELAGANAMAGRLASGMFMFGVGGTVTLAVTAGLALMAGAWRFFTRDARAAAAAAKDVSTRLLELRNAADPTRAPSLELKTAQFNLAAAANELGAFRTKMIAKFGSLDKIPGFQDRQMLDRLETRAGEQLELVERLQARLLDVMGEAGDAAGREMVEALRKAIDSADVGQLLKILDELQTKIAQGGEVVRRQLGEPLKDVVELLQAAGELLGPRFSAGGAVVAASRTAVFQGFGAPQSQTTGPFAAFGTGPGAVTAATAARNAGQAAAEQQHYAQALDFTRGVLARTLSPQQIFNQGMAMLNTIFPEAERGTQEYAAAVKQLTDDMERATKGSGLLAASIIHAVAGAIAAVVSGGSPGGVLSAIGGAIGLFNPVAGAIVGGIGQVVMASESRGVTIDRYSREALDQLRGVNNAPQRIEFLVQSPTTGEIVDRVIYTLGERTRNDGVRRVPLILVGR